MDDSWRLPFSRRSARRSQKAANYNDRMAEPNPYESPKTEQALEPQQVAKRAVNPTFFLLATLLASAVAFILNYTINLNAPMPRVNWPLLITCSALPVIVGLAWFAIARWHDHRAN
jgi:hypothetical protein